MALLHLHASCRKMSPDGARVLHPVEISVPILKLGTLQPALLLASFYDVSSTGY